MDTRLDADRNLLFGLLALRMGFLGAEVLVAELNAWALRKERPLGVLLEEQGTLTADRRALVDEAVATYLANYDGDPRATLGALGPARADFARIADPALQAALTHLGPDGENGGEDPTATRAFADDPSATRVDPGSPPTYLAPPSDVADPFATQFDPQLGGDGTLASGPGPQPSRGLAEAKTIAEPTMAGEDLYATRVEASWPAAEAEAEADPSRPAPGSPDSGFRPSRGGASARTIRYRTLRPHAKGGLGEVFVALDEELGREVALKEIQGRHADRPESRTRFLLEAEVTGGLEHPGIVPVYGLGQYADGRPYYAMRFIRGHTLKEAIEEFHEADKSGRDPGRRELELRLLLNRFIDVCDAMAYAHARGIIHRDLKPANIMLGSFGETLVVDWGLAKPLDRTEADDADDADLQRLRPMSASGNSETLFGSTVGTPHYMSPEQAEGRLDRLGPASDVYSLGATLYCLLTGLTPFNDRNITVLLEKVRKGDFPPPRQVNRRVPPALEAICLKAMALRPDDRYPSARALAGDLERWLGDEPVSVYREPFAARLARWAKRHKTLVTSTVALLLTAVTALTIGTVLIRREQAKTERNFQLARQNFRMAQRNFQLAEANFGLARSAVDQMLTQLGQVDLADIPQMEPVRKRMLGKALDFYRTFLAARGDDPTIRLETGRANVRLGDIQEMLGDYAEAEHAYDRAIALLAPLASAKGVGADPRRDLAWAQHDRALLLKKSNRFLESDRGFREALRLRKQLVAEDPASIADREAEQSTVYHLGALLARLEGTHEEVEAAYRGAIAEQKRLAARDPGQPSYASDLARSLNNQGILLATNDPRAAEAAYREALKLERDLVGRSPTVATYQWLLARTLNNLGKPLEFEKDRDGALANYREAYSTLKRLADDYPTVPDYQNELAVIHANLGMALLGTRPRDQGGAEEHIRAAVALADALVKRSPNRPDYHYKRALFRRRLGIALKADHKAEAEQAFRDSLGDLEALVAAYPRVPEYQSELGLALDSLGLQLDSRGQVAEAARLVERAIGRQRSALEANPTNDYVRQYLLTDYQYLERMLGYLNDHAACASAGEELVRTLPDDGRAHRIAARLLARAAALAAKDAKLPEAERLSLARSHADRAVNELNRAADRRALSPRELADPVYDAIDDRDDFRRLKESLSAKERRA